MNEERPTNTSAGCAHHASGRMVRPNPRCLIAKSVCVIANAPTGLLRLFLTAQAEVKQWKKLQTPNFKLQRSFKHQSSSTEKPGGKNQLYTPSSLCHAAVL